jgi:hypothetical protein
MRETEIDPDPGRAWPAREFAAVPEGAMPLEPPPVADHWTRDEWARVPDRASPLQGKPGAGQLADNVPPQSPLEPRHIFDPEKQEQFGILLQPDKNIALDVVQIQGRAAPLHQAKLLRSSKSPTKSTNIRQGAARLTLCNLPSRFERPGEMLRCRAGWEWLA